MIIILSLFIFSIVISGITIYVLDLILDRDISKFIKQDYAKGNISTFIIMFTIWLLASLSLLSELIALYTLILKHQL